MTCKNVQIANCSITKYVNSQIFTILMQETKLIYSDFGERQPETKRCTSDFKLSIR